MLDCEFLCQQPTEKGISTHANAKQGVDKETSALKGINLLRCLLNADDAAPLGERIV
jgi:hypothetical protein